MTDWPEAVREWEDAWTCHNYHYGTLVEKEKADAAIASLKQMYEGAMDESRRYQIANGELKDALSEAEAALREEVATKMMLGGKLRESEAKNNELLEDYNDLMGALEAMTVKRDRAAARAEEQRTQWKKWANRALKEKARAEEAEAALAEFRYQETTGSDKDRIEGLEAEVKRQRNMLVLKGRQNNLLVAEVEKWAQAVGLASTALPEMQIDADDPIGMMQKVVAEVTRLKSEFARGLRLLRDCQYANDDMALVELDDLLESNATREER